MPTVSRVLGAVHGVRGGRIYEWATSIISMQLYEVSFGASENYATGGIDVRTGILASNPEIQEIVGVAVLQHNVNGWIPFYNAATGRLQFFGQEPTSTSSGVVALSEMGNGSTAINNRFVRLLVFGV